MIFSVYILYSKTCKRFYTGHTHDLNNRIDEHNRGETKSIKNCAPNDRVWHIEVATRSEAMVMESKIKKRGASRFLADLGIKVDH